MTTKEFTDLASAFNPLVTWFLVVVGWLVVSAQNDKRETRKETRASIDGLIEKVNSTLDEATTFYMKEGGDKESDLKRALLLRSLSSVTTSVTRLAGEDANKPIVIKATALRQAITLHGFDDRKRAPYSYSDQKIAEIRNAAQELIMCLERAFAAKYADDTPTTLN